jgi:hypothetical protein
MLAGSPAAAFPKEMWLSQVQPGEFAVRIMPGDILRGV